MSVQTSQSDSSSAKPVILLICIEQRGLFDDLYTGLIDQMAEKATLKRATKPQTAANYLANNQPLAVIIADGASATKKKQFGDLNSALVTYVRNGGTVILGALFSGTVSPSNFNQWMTETWSLPWKFGDYHRTDVFQNPACDLEGYQSGTLADSYSQKAVFLQNVDKTSAVYLPSRNSQTQSMVFVPTSVDVAQTPVAFAKLGAGRLWYIGDVNNEDASKVALMMMCKL